MAIALIVSETKTWIGPEYSFEEADGVTRIFRINSSSRRGDAGVSMALSGIAHRSAVAQSKLTIIGKKFIITTDHRQIRYY